MVTDPIPPHDGGWVIDNGEFKSAGAYGDHNIYQGK